MHVDEDGSEGSHAVSPETVSRIRTAQGIEEAQVFLRAMWLTDYFAGYSLAEVLDEQIRLIGSDGLGEEYPTKLKQIENFRMNALAAISKAEEYLTK